MSGSEQEIPKKKHLIALLVERWVSLEVAYALAIYDLYRLENLLMNRVAPLLAQRKRWNQRIALSNKRIDALRDARDCGHLPVLPDNTVPIALETENLQDIEVLPGNASELLTHGLSLLLPELRRFDVEESVIRGRLAEFAKAFFAMDLELMRLLLGDVETWPVLEETDDPVARIRHAAQLRRLIKETEARHYQLKQTPLYQLMDCTDDDSEFSDVCHLLQQEIRRLSFAFMSQQVREAQLWGALDA